MVVSGNWLNEYVDVPKDLPALSERLTLSGTEVERIQVQEVDFDGIVDRVAAAAAEVGAAESKVSLHRVGTFGVLPAEVATPLVMVLNELLQNAVGHAFAPGTAGEVVIDPPEDVVTQFRRRASAAADRERLALAQAGSAAVTRDGVGILVGANLGSVQDARAAH